MKNIHKHIIDFIINDNKINDQFLLNNVVNRHKNYSKQVNNILKASENIDKKSINSIDVYEEFDKLDNKIKKSRHLVILNTLKYASIILIILSIGIIFYPSENFNKKNGYTIYKTGKGESSELNLIDGSKITLYSNSKLLIPNTFNSNNRNIEAYGELFCDIKHNPKSPFTLKSEEYKLKVLGTKFSFENRDHNLISAYLEKGKIEIDLESYKLNKYILTPNESLKFNIKELNIDYYKYNAKSLISDKGTKFIFNDLEFNEIVKDIGNFFNKIIIIENDTIASQKLTGEFQNRTSKEMLNSFKRLIDFEIIEENNKIYIR